MNRFAILIVPSALIAAAIAQPPSTEPELKAPPVIAPGPTAAAAPSDATVLIDGKSLDGWMKRDGKPAAWKADERAGTFTVAAGAGDIVSKATFADAQIHVEFMTPEEKGDGQDRGNSGVYIHGRYEVQILDSHQSQTYPDGQCGAIYKQHVPLVNACRPQGQWQTYDIIFRAPRFDAGGKKTSNAMITVFHNGVLIQDHAEATTPTGSAIDQKEIPVGPLMLQEHGHPVVYRNVWVRKI